MKARLITIAITSKMMILRIYQNVTAIGCKGRAPWHFAVCHLWIMGLALVGFSVTGCRHGGAGMGRSEKDVLASFDTDDGYVFLEGEQMRAVMRPDAFATVVVSSQEGEAPVLVEYPVSGQWAARAQQPADHLVVGATGPLEVQTTGWEIVDHRADALSVEHQLQLTGQQDDPFRILAQREVRLHGKSSLDGFMTEALLDDVQVSGYESRTIFSNPGPLSWSRRGALPYIQVVGEVVRSRDAVVLLHVRPGSNGLMGDQLTQDTVVHDAILLVPLENMTEDRMVLPRDFVTPRVAILDRDAEMLTLVSFDPTTGTAARRQEIVNQPDAEILVFASGDKRGIRTVTSGGALPLATGGSTRHHRQTFHVRGDWETLLPIAAAFCRLTLEDVMIAWDEWNTRERE